MKYAYAVRSGSALQLLKTIQAYFQSPVKSNVVYQLQEHLGPLFPMDSVIWATSYYH